MLIASFIAPDDLADKFAMRYKKNRCEEFVLDKVRTEAVLFLAALAKKGMTMDYQEFMEWVQHWFEDEGRYTFRLVFGLDPELERWSGRVGSSLLLRNGILRRDLKRRFGRGRGAMKSEAWIVARRARQGCKAKEQQVARGWKN